MLSLLINLCLPLMVTLQNRMPEENTTSICVVSSRDVTGIIIQASIVLLVVRRPSTVSEELRCVVHLLWLVPLHRDIHSNHLLAVMIMVGIEEGEVVVMEEEKEKDRKRQR